MGNCQCDEVSTIEFKFDNRDIILLKENKDESNKITILENIEETNENKNFFNLISKIYNNLEKFSDDNKSIIKMSIKKIIEKNFSKDDIKNYLDTIDKISKNKNDFEEIKNLIDLFKFIYLDKDKFDKDKIKYFIDTINYILEENKIISEKELVSFVDYLYNNFQIISKETNSLIQINKEDQDGKNISKIQTNVESEKNKKELDNDFDNNLERKESSQSKRSYQSKQSKSSVFSTYSKNSQHQILKMEKESKIKDKVIESLLDGEKKKIIFYNENDKKEYPLMIPIKDKQFEIITELFYLKYPKQRRQLGAIYTYKTKEINLFYMSILIKETT